MVNAKIDKSKTKNKKTDGSLFKELFPGHVSHFCHMLTFKNIIS